MLIDDFKFGANCDKITAIRIKKHPIILFIFNTWFKIIHPATAANTPSKEYIIAAGCCALSCQTGPNRICCAADYQPWSCNAEW